MYLKKPIVFKYLIRDMKWELIILAALCIAIGELDDNLYLLDEFNLAIPSFIGTILVITVAFRTNKAYGRWWEAKKVWEEISNNVRAWNRLVLSSINNETGEILAHKQIAWMYTLAYRLRGVDAPKHHLNGFSADEKAKIKRHDNLNQRILVMQSEKLFEKFQDKTLPEFIHLKLERIQRELEASMGKAERIKKTHFPHPYDLLIHVTIYLFAIVSAYFIDDDITVFEASVSFLVSALFLSFHYIARQMQDPFENTPSDTPMLWYCYQLEKELNEMVKREVATQNTHDFDEYLM